MPFIGNQPAEAYSAFQKQDFTTSATTSYTLDHPVSNQNEIALFINFVRQEPTAAYTASGTSLTLTSATSASDDMYCVYLGKAVQTVNPASGSVGSSQVAASIITGQTALGAIPADTDELLISDAGTLKRVDYSYLKQANTPAFEASLSSDQTVTGGTETLIAYNTEHLDTDNAYDTSTYKFTPQTAGKYYVYANAQQFTSNNTLSYIDIRKNSTRIARFAVDHRTAGLGTSNSHFVAAIADMNGSSDFLSVYANFNGTSPVRIAAYTTSSPTTLFGAYKLIGV